jgi:hypothetical protein
VSAGQPAEIEVRELFEPEDFAAAWARRVSQNNRVAVVDPRPTGLSY